jgi:hypothetical protein
MKQFEKIKPTILELFENHSEFYRLYRDKEKLFIAFSDMAMALTAVGWDIYFLEVYHKLSPQKKQLAYGKVCKNSDSLFSAMKKARENYVKPESSDPSDRIGFAVDLKHIIDDRISNHPKFIKTFSSFEKLFLVFDDILILIETIGGSFYNWELFKRVGDVEVEHVKNGARVGFDKIRDVVLELRKEYDND